MTKNQKLSVFFGGLLLVACTLVSTQAQPARRPGAATGRSGGDYIAKPAETKPADAKPAETKPIETKRVEAPPVKPQPAETNSERTVSELRCRGGKNAFQLNSGSIDYVGRDHKRHILFRLDFNSANGPARDDGSGLDEGTCSLIVRALSASEPRQISFNAPPLLVDIGRAHEHDRRTALSEYFNDPSHFWSFFVYDAGEGYFQATRHKILLDPRKVGVDERLRRR